MPEGLANNMTEQDFRDLVRYLLASPFLTEVRVLGPLTPGQEKLSGDGDPQAPDGVAWERPSVGLAGRIGLPRTSGGPKVAVVAARVVAAGPVRTRLQLGAAHPVEAWLNGKKVYSGRPAEKTAAPDQAGVEVELQSGENRLVLVVRYEGTSEAVYARLLDPNRKLANPAP